LSDHLSRPVDRIRSDDYLAKGERAEIVAAVESVFDVVEQGRFKEFSKCIVAADRVWVATGETSRAGGYALHSGLSMIREGVRLIGEHSVASDLTDAGPAAEARNLEMQKVLVGVHLDRFDGTGSQGPVRRSLERYTHDIPFDHHREGSSRNARRNRPP